MIIPDSGDGNISAKSFYKLYHEGIDNPRLRGRKRSCVSCNSASSAKELIIPDSGDGNPVDLISLRRP